MTPVEHYARAWVGESESCAGTRNSFGTGFATRGATRMRALSSNERDHDENWSIGWRRQRTMNPKGDKKITRITVFAASLSLAACASVQQFKGPSGATAYSVFCRGDLAACYRKAGEACPVGYSVVDRSSNVLAFPVPEHNLAVECTQGERS